MRPLRRRASPPPSATRHRAVPWRRPGAPTRDYFRAEDALGRRFWLYREDLYGRETTQAKWFVHGVFG